jgi:hypothetical protein
MKFHRHFAIGSLLASSFASAVPLTLTNTDFSGGVSSGNNPAGWTTTEALAGNLGIQTPPTSQLPSNGVVLTFQGRSTVNNIQQNFLTSEVTADTYGIFTVAFEAGWRNNTAAPNDMGWTVSIINVTDGGVLGSATYTLPPNSPSNLSDNYRTLGVRSLVINYDNTIATLVGDTIAIQIESNSSQNNFNPTGWIDNISVSASAAADPLLVVADPVSFTTHNALEVLSIPVSNAGLTQNLNITAVTPGGADGSNFSVAPGDLPIVIPPSGSGSIPVTFTPSGTFQATYTATLEITSDDAASPTTLTLNLANEPDPWIIASNTDFTNNGSPETYTVTISNDGSAQTLNIGTVTAGGFDAYTVSNITPPTGILPGESGDITFTFTPDISGGAVITGGYEFTLVIPSDDPATPSKEININIVVSDPIILVDETPADFGILANGAAAQPQIITVSNDGGTEDLIIADTTAITGASAFTITNTTFPITIVPGGFAEIEVTLSPGTAVGRLNAALQIDSNDYNNTVPIIPLTAFIEPAGTLLARFDFDPVFVFGTTVDTDDTTLAAVELGDLTDMATGTGALSQSNQGGSNRSIASGTNGNYLRFSSNRESDSAIPTSPSPGESTWTTFTTTPQAGGGAIDFTGGTAVIDTYADTDLGTNTAANWSLYYSTDGGSTWTFLSFAAGASTTNGRSAPLGVSWDLTPIGNQTVPVIFALDPVSTGNTNGAVGQRSVGFDNLIVTAGSVTPGTGGNYASWATANGVTGGPDGDSDNDGIPNLVEYAINLNFAGSDGSAGTLTGKVLSFTKRAEAVTNGDVSYSIETSPDLLEPWTHVSYVLPDVNDGTTISYTLPTGLGKIFARLVVTEIP